MRIALVCPYDVAVPGGVQAQVLGLGRALAAAGHGVVVVAPGPKGAAQLGGLHVVGVGRSFTVRANGSLAPVAPTPAAMLRTRRALRDAAADVVHVHEPLVPGPALAAATTSGAPVVGSFHRARASRTYVAYGHALRRVVRGLDDRVAVSAVARATLWAAAGPCECAILANAIDLERFAGAAPVPAEAPTVLFVGRLEPRKGLGVLLEAYGGLAGDSRLRIIGAGPEAATLRRRYDHDRRISWLGPVSDQELDRELSAAQVLAAPSLGGESFGVVLLEAMAAGTAVVASDIPGYRLAAAGAAALVPPGDAAALRRALESLLSNAVERDRLVAAGRLVAARHSFGDLATAYEARYAALLATPSRGSAWRGATH
jgi:phosphatidylinositol alpha-mannosyltransferase